MTEGPRKVVCEICGQAKPLAKLAGRYYCYECARKVLEEHILTQLKELERRGIVQLASLRRGRAEPPAG